MKAVLVDALVMAMITVEAAAVAATVVVNSTVTIAKQLKPMRYSAHVK